MDENFAWEKFLKSGSVNDFLEYKNICNDLKIGENIEADKSKGNNNKGNEL